MDLFSEVERTMHRRSPLFTIVPIFIGVVFVLIIAYYAIVGTVIFKVAQNPEGTAHRMGEIAREFERGYEAQ